MEETAKPFRSPICRIDSARRLWRGSRSFSLERNVPLARAARDGGIAHRTERRWLQSFRAKGLAGLVRAARSDAGQRKLTADLIALIEGRALRKPRPSVAALHSEVTKVAADRAIAAPSYATVHAIARA